MTGSAPRHKIAQYETFLGLGQKVKRKVTLQSQMLKYLHDIAIQG